MASTEKRKILSAIAPTLKAAGFKKKGPTWYRTQGGFTQVFNVQGSQWGKSFYLNLGIYITALGKREAPQEYHCHIRNRAGCLVADIGRYNQLLDFGEDIAEEVRFSEVNKIIEEHALPWLEEFSNDKKVIDWITGEQPHGLPILQEVFDHYGVDRP